MGETTRDSSIPQLGGAGGLAKDTTSPLSVNTLYQTDGAWLGEPLAAAQGTPFSNFIYEINRILSGKAAQKGYNDAGPDADNRLYLFVRDFVSGTKHDHALGEIIYKVVRFVKKGAPEDLLKIAAWAYLVYCHEVKSG